MGACAEWPRRCCPTRRPCAAARLVRPNRIPIAARPRAGPRRPAPCADETRVKSSDHYRESLLVEKFASPTLRLVRAGGRLAGGGGGERHAAEAGDGRAWARAGGEAGEAGEARCMGRGIGCVQPRLPNGTHVPDGAGHDSHARAH